MIEVSTVFDSLSVYCPRLGGSVEFIYCRRVAEGLPCSRALTCWEMIFPVAEYMYRVLSQEEWEKAFMGPPKGRLDVILTAAAKPREDKSQS